MPASVVVTAKRKRVQGPSGRATKVSLRESATPLLPACPLSGISALAAALVWSARGAVHVLLLNEVFRVLGDELRRRVFAPRLERKNINVRLPLTRVGKMSCAGALSPLRSGVSVCNASHGVTFPKLNGALRCAGRSICGPNAFEVPLLLGANCLADERRGSSRRGESSSDYFYFAWRLMSTFLKVPQPPVSREPPVLSPAPPGAGGHRRSHLLQLYPPVHYHHGPGRSIRPQHRPLGQYHGEQPP